HFRSAWFHGPDEGAGPEPSHATEVLDAHDVEACLLEQPAQGPVGEEANVVALDREMAVEADGGDGQVLQSPVVRRGQGEAAAVTQRSPRALEQSPRPQQVLEDVERDHRVEALRIDRPGDVLE